MPVLSSINSARLLQNASVDWNVTTNTGIITAPYVLTKTTTVAGVLTFTDIPNLTRAGTAQVSLSPTDTVAERLSALCALIASQEGLTLPAGGGTDAIYDPHGQQVA